LALLDFNYWTYGINAPGEAWALVLRPLSPAEARRSRPRGPVKRGVWSPGSEQATLSVRLVTKPKQPLLAADAVAGGGGKSSRNLSAPAQPAGCRGCGRNRGGLRGGGESGPGSPVAALPALSPREGDPPT
jgi:hypothetical protein